MSRRLSSFFAIACATALLSCTGGSATPMATSKAATTSSATFEPLAACSKRTPPASVPGKPGDVDQGALDRWLVQLAGSFVGHQHAVARSDLKSRDGAVLVRSGESVHAIAGQRIATGDDVLALYTRLQAPMPFTIVTVESGEENTVRSRVAASPGQATFLASAQTLVAGNRGAELHVDRLAFRAMRADHTLATHSAQWLSNGTHGGGLRLAAVRAGWLYHTLGLRSGDLLHAVDGVVYGSAGQLQRALYTASLSASPDRVRLELTRDGEHTELVYRFVGESYRRQDAPACN